MLIKWRYLGELPSPSISVVIPVRNEERWIGRAITSVLRQTYPSDRLEVIIALGPSTDRTREIVESIARHDDRIRIIGNDSGLTPVALNLGIAAATGAIIARVDGHGWIEPDYIAQGVDAIVRTGADAVGGVAHFVGHGNVGEAIAVAMRSRLGAGTAAFRVARSEVDADGLRWGMYPRELFDLVGMFDEGLKRNQDDELCQRVREAGGRMLVTPRMRFTQVGRDSLAGLFRQYFEWGEFRVATLTKHRRPGSPRQLLPPLAVGFLFVGLSIDAASAGRRRIGRVALGTYVGGLALGGTFAASRNGRTLLAPLVAAAMGTMHVAYGLGFWRNVSRPTWRRP